MNFSGKRVLILGDSLTVGGYGQNLEAALEGEGAKVDRIAHIGANATHYISNKWSGKGWMIRSKSSGLPPEGEDTTKTATVDSPAEFKAAIGKYDVVIISLGTNDGAGTKTPKEATQVAERLSKLATDVKAPVVLYVGAPYIDPQVALYYGCKPVKGGIEKCETSAYTKLDLNTRIAMVYDAVLPLFGPRAYDSRPATKSLANPSDIHPTSAGYKAWSSAVHDWLKSLPEMTSNEPMAITTKPGVSSMKPMTAGAGGPGGAAIIGIVALISAFLWFKSRR